MKKCDFCEKEEKDVLKLIVSENSNICDDCVDTCIKILDTKPLDDSNDIQPVVKLSKTPKQIVKELNKDVIGQLSAKKSLSVAAFNHYKRLNDESIEKSNILLIGPSGSGKTLICEKLSKIMNVPFAMADATTLTESGYIGDDVESIITKLYLQSNHDIELTEKGIVFIDEIDKISSSNNNKPEVSNKGVQYALLKLLEGKEVYISPSMAKKETSTEEKIKIDTSNILFIAAGAFTGIDAAVDTRTSNRSIGITANVSKTQDIESLVSQVTTADLEEYGLIKELIGRLPFVVKLNPIKEAELKKILTSPRNSIINQYKSLLQADGNLLTFENGAINLVVKMALKNKTGARGLRGILEPLLNEVMFESPSLPKGSEIVITKDYVAGLELTPVYIKPKKKPLTR